MDNKFKSSPGAELNRLLDSMGFPDHIADLYGTALDNAIQDDLEVAKNLFNAFSGLNTSDLKHVGMGEPAYCPKPKRFVL